MINGSFRSFDIIDLFISVYIGKVIGVVCLFVFGCGSLYVFFGIIELGLDVNVLDEGKVCLLIGEVFGIVVGDDDEVLMLMEYDCLNIIFV